VTRAVRFEFTRNLTELRFWWQISNTLDTLEIVILIHYK
jgi:hypothetical protein